MKKRSDKNIVTSAVAGFAGIINDAMLPPAGVELDAVSMMVENKRGTQMPNPLISVIDTLERRQLAVIRSMSLNQTADDPHTVNVTAKVESEGRAALKDVGVAGLIAQPYC